MLDVTAPASVLPIMKGERLYSAELHLSILSVPERSIIMQVLPVSVHCLTDLFVLGVIILLSYPPLVASQLYSDKKAYLIAIE